MLKTCLALSCLVLACTSAKDIDPPDPPDDWIPEDIDLDQTVDKLGAAGFAKVCNAFEDYVRDMYRSNRLIQLTCTAEALDTTANATACRQ